jgi:hypothetical protein
MTSEEIIKLVLQTVGQEDLKRLGEEAVKVKDALQKTGDAMSQVEKKSIDLEALASQGKGLFAVFQTGEIPGIIRGVGEMIDLVPGLNSFAPAIKKIGDVSEVAWPFLKDLYTTITKEPEKVKEATEAIADYGERIDELGESVTNMTDRQASLNAELERGKKALEDQAKRVQELNALQPHQSESVAEAASERAENLTSVFGGRQEDLVEHVSRAMAKKERAEKTAELEALGGTADKMAAEGKAVPEAILQSIGKLQDRLDEFKKGIPKDSQDAARKLLADAIRGGKEDAVRQIAGLLPAQGAGSEFKQGFKRELPEEKAIDQEDEQAFQDSLDKRSKAVKRRNERMRHNQEGQAEAAVWEEKFAADKAGNDAALEASMRTGTRQMRQGMQQEIKDDNVASKQMAGMARQIGELNRLQQQAVEAAGMQGNNQGLLLQQIKDRDTQIQRLKAQAKEIERAAKMNNSPFQQNRTAMSGGFN